MNISIRELIELAEATPCLPEKESMMRRCDQGVLKDILEDANDESRDYGRWNSTELIRAFGHPGSGDYCLDQDYGVFHTVLRDLARVEGSQKEFYGQVLWCCIGTYQREDQEILMRILDRGLKIGYAGI